MEVAQADAGEIVFMAGLQSPIANVTVCAPEVASPLEVLRLAVDVKGGSGD